MMIVLDDGTVFEHPDVGPLMKCAAGVQLWKHRTQEGAYLLVRKDSDSLVALLQFKRGWHTWQKPDTALSWDNWVASDSVTV